MEASFGKLWGSRLIRSPGVYIEDQVIMSTRTSRLTNVLAIQTGTSPSMFLVGNLSFHVAVYAFILEIPEGDHRLGGVQQYHACVIFLLGSAVTGGGSCALLGYSQGLPGW